MTDMRVKVHPHGSFTAIDIEGFEEGNLAFDHQKGTLLVHADGGEEPTHKIDLPTDE